MTDKSRAAAKAEEVLQKMQATLAISTTKTNNSMASAEVDSILGKMQKEAMGQTNRQYMQVIGLEEEVRLKELTIGGLHSKISALERQIYQSNAKIVHMEDLESENKEIKAAIKEQEAKMSHFEELEVENKKLKEKNTKVLQTAKEHQKSWKNHISKLEMKLLETENENRHLRSKMAKLVRKLETAIAEFSDLNDQDGSLALTTNSSESENCDTNEDESQDNRDDCEKETTLEKFLNAGIDPVADKINNPVFFSHFQAAKE